MSKIRKKNKRNFPLQNRECGNPISMEAPLLVEIEPLPDEKIPCFSSVNFLHSCKIR